MSRDAKDLRIGNWIFDSECEPHYFQVEQIRKHVGQSLWVCYRNGSIKSKEPEPIPLTPEILLSCGFTEAPETDPYGFYLSPEFQDCKIRVREDEFGWYWQYGSATIRLPYLHQLQNLYYCLTGSELEINF